MSSFDKSQPTRKTKARARAKKDDDEDDDSYSERASALRVFLEVPDYCSRLSGRT
jgi:hypothetical protein